MELEKHISDVMELISVAFSIMHTELVTALKVKGSRHQNSSLVVFSLKRIAVGFFFTAPMIKKIDISALRGGAT
jgi:hypothetical protein